MSASVLYMSMSLDGYIAGPNDAPGNPGGDGFTRLHDWYGFDSSDQGPGLDSVHNSGSSTHFLALLILPWVDHASPRPGRGGQYPPRSSNARAIKCSGFLNPNAMR